ncbi:NlpC/P60 family protein [Ectopseudomonas hydrolytica]|uniref:NlpC/P60 family protein n=1 Tax=Ectopseudomonas hydrolytica TaxID=2493633 RepID=UPI00376EA193
MMKPADVITASRAYLEVPFRHQGRTPPLALDCAGLFVMVCRDMGLPVIDEQGYGRNPWRGLLEQCIARQPFLCRVPREQMQAGDVLLMKFEGDPQHIAIHAGDTMIHAYEKSGKVVEHRLADVWRARVVSVYRFEGMR